MRHLTLTFSLLAPALGGCADATEGTPRWDRSDDAVVIDATSCCGFVADTAAANYVPDARVWGNGRIVWTEYADDGSRAVREGQLTEAELADLLDAIDYAGFFGWDDEYIDATTPEDVPPLRLTVSLIDDAHAVVDYGFSGPYMFRKLFETVSSGAGVDGDDYSLDTAFLRTQPAEDLMVENSPSWDSDAVGFDLDVAAEGVWIEGTTLEAAWDVVNHSPWYPVAAQGEREFSLALQIPELTTEPIED